MNPILVNSRSFLLNLKDANKQILKALSYDIDGVKASFLKREELMDFKPNTKVKKELKNYYNILHAPTNHVYYNNPITNKILKKLKSLYKSLNCDCIVFHHNNLFKPEYIMKELKGFNISVENLDVRTKVNNSVKYLKGFFRKYSDYGLTLDFCHAMSHSKNRLHELVKELSSKVVNIHWSLNKTDWLRHHSPFQLYKTRKNDVDYMFKQLKKFKQPVVLEIRRNYVEKNFNIIQDEIDFLKSKLLPA
jgi:hypothetical protein